MSGSSEFTPDGLKKIVAQTPKGFYVLDVDIRQESHGYDGAVALGWWKRNNSGNAHRTVHAAMQDEAVRLGALQGLRSEGHYAAYAFRKKEVLGRRVTMRAHDAYDEATLARSEGISYARIPMTDRAPTPTDVTVDLFVARLLSLRDDTWVHFHCLHGHGRTTLFMAMYDMLRNADRVPLDDIIHRQFLMGGIDLRRKPQATATFLRRFHAFSQACLYAVNTGTQVPLWSVWRANVAMVESIQNYIDS